MPSINVLNELQIKQNGVTTTYKLGTVNGYYNTVDGKFYQESTYVTEIAGAPNLVYADIGGNNLYIWKASTSSFVKVSGEGGSSADNLKFGYLKEANGKFYEDSSYTVEIPGDDENLFITLDTNFIYRYDTTNTEFIQIGDGSGAETIKYVNALPTTNIEDIIYGIISRISYSETVADNFLDTNNLFEKTEEGDDYTYTAKDGVEIEASTNGTTYKAFESLAFSDSDSEFTLTYGDTSTSTLVNGNTFYFKQVNRNYYAGNEEEQSVTPFASGGGSGGGATYVPGEGVNINNNVISLSPATSSTLGGIKPDDETIKVNNNGILSGNYQGGYGIDITDNIIKAKTFVGTQAEWDALTTDEKANFDTVSITDDGQAEDTNPGHEVLESSGTALPQRNKMQFNDMTVTDDSVNDKTIVAPVPYTAGRGIDINTNKEIAVENNIKTTFVGTISEWEALTTAEKAEYELVSLIDDPAGGDIYVEDAVTKNSINPVTSGAVFDAINGKVIGGNTGSTVVPANGYTDVDISFGTTYTKSPKSAVATMKSTGSVSNFKNLTVCCYSFTTTGFKVRFYNGTSNELTLTANWIAVF